MKKWILLGIMAAMCVGGCGKKEKIAEQPTTQATEVSVSEQQETVAESQQEAESAVQKDVNPNASEDFINHFSEVTIEGTTIRFPISYSELESLGFQLKSSQTEMVPAGNAVSGTSGWGSEQKGNFAMFYRHKESEGSKALAECDAVSFTWDVDAAQGVDVSFYGGIHEGSTREEVAALLDEVYVDETSALYMTSADNAGYAELSVSFDGDRMVMVELYNYADYMN